MLHKERIRRINGEEVRDRDFVVYWMQNAQRTQGNHALEHAVEWSNRLGKPLLVCFGLTDAYPEANERHYAFMLEGLQEVAANLSERGIRFLVRKIRPDQGALDLAPVSAIIVTEKAYLRHERAWRATLAEKADCAVEEVETNVVVPVGDVSWKEEYAAATIRKKINSQVPAYLQPLKERKVLVPSAGIALPFDELDLQEDHGIDCILADLDIDRSVPRLRDLRGGTGEGMDRFRDFLERKLEGYATLRNDPGQDYSSGVSPYLHFGQLSPLILALEVSRIRGACSEAFLEELLVRRELAFNFVSYNEAYDRYDGLPDWARRTLDKHRADPRVPMYGLEELEQGDTHDPYWNAAQLELAATGRMHNYMRMYWGKKILEWTSEPEEAFRRALFLNNKYAMDGRDPNSFAGVAWCFGKHDRPWQERPVFGMIRYMNDKGLERKFRMKRYLDKVADLVRGV